MEAGCFGIFLFSFYFIKMETSLHNALDDPVVLQNAVPSGRADIGTDKMEVKLTCNATGQDRDVLAIAWTLHYQLLESL